MDVDVTVRKRHPDVQMGLFLMQGSTVVNITSCTVLGPTKYVNVCCNCLTDPVGDFCKLRC